MRFSVALIGRLLKAFPGMVKGVKDSSGDFTNSRAYVDHFAGDGFKCTPAMTACCARCWKPAPPVASLRHRT